MKNRARNKARGYAEFGVASVSLFTLAAVVAGCGFGAKRRDVAEDTAKVASTEILMEPRYELNFQPSLEHAQFIQFVIAHATDASPVYTFKATNTKGEDISSVFGAHKLDVMRTDNGRYTIKVSVPFLLTEKTIGGFRAAVSLSNLKTPDGNEIRKETVFSLAAGAYPQDHMATDSGLSDFAIANEFLLPVEKADLDLVSFVEHVLSSPALGSAQETDRIRLKNRLEIVQEGSQKVLSLKGSVAFSYSTPGTATVRTNGHRLIVLGGDWSKVKIEVGHLPTVRKSGSASAPEVALYTLQPPQLIHQLKSDDPEGPYPAARGARGQAADLSRCNQLVTKLTQGIDGFPGERASCKDDLKTISGENQSLTLSFRRAEHAVPVAPESSERLDELVSLKKPDGSSLFSDLQGRPCVLDEANQAHDTCVFANYTRGYLPRADLNAGGELASYLTTYHAGKLVPYLQDEGSGGYQGPGTVTATRQNRRDPNEKLQGRLVAKPDLGALQGKMSGWEGHWKEGGSAYGAIAQACFETLRTAAANQDLRIPGARPDPASLVPVESDSDKTRSISFGTRFPGLSLIDSVAFSTKVGDAQGGSLEISTGDTGEFLSLEGKKIYRLKESYRNKLRPLAHKLTVLGEPGQNGADAPALKAFFPVAIDERDLLAQYETLAGPAGLPGLPLGFPHQKERALHAGAFTLLLKDAANNGVPAAEIDAHLKATYDVTVKRNEAGQVLGFEYLPLTAELKPGNELTYEFVASEMHAQAQASFDVYSRVTGVVTLSQMPNLEIAPTVSTPGQGSVQGAGLRVGVTSQASSPLSGFFGFRQGQMPALFRNGYHALGGAPTGGRPSGSAGGENGGGLANKDNGELQGAKKVKEWANEVYDSAKRFFTEPNSNHNDHSLKHKDNELFQRYEKAEAAIPLSPRFFMEVADIDCKSTGLFGSNQISAMGRPIDMHSYAWRAKAPKHFWIDDAGYPGCGMVNGRFLYPQNCKRSERASDNDQIVSENGKQWHRWPGSWGEYQAEIKAACEASPDIQKAVAAAQKEEVNRNFHTRCAANDGCLQTKNAIEFLVKNTVESLEGFSGHIIQDERFSPAHIQALKSALTTITHQKGAWIEVFNGAKNYGFTTEPFNKDGVTDLELLERLKPWNDIGSFDRLIGETAQKIARMETVAKPSLSSGALPQCSYDIQGGRFRYYGQAKLTSAVSTAGGLPKVRNERTTLKRDYRYPKAGATTVTDDVQSPDTSPLIPSSETLILQEPSNAKAGVAQNLTRGVLVDCADLANVARREKLPLPRKMFSTELCKSTLPTLQTN